VGKVSGGFSEGTSLDFGGPVFKKLLPALFDFLSNCLKTLGKFFEAGWALFEFGFEGAERGHGMKGVNWR
jgi:hypothetical protein